MGHTFEFNFSEAIAQNLLNIEDIGNCAVEAISDEGYFYYWVILTSLGTSTICSCGPIIPDVTLLPNGYCCSLDRTEFKEYKIIKRIDYFLVNKYYNIIEAKIIPVKEAIAQFRDLKDYLSHYGEKGIY